MGLVRFLANHATAAESNTEDIGAFGILGVVAGFFSGVLPDDQDFGPAVLLVFTDDLFVKSDFIFVG